ncbi:hypothetical protein MC378_12305 [Polaribacter sp. MSW13]|uniref:Uncharacterized protein n=1 Tax=Polaribacter marinus TaxID=2916838 RepID=A0A9X1VUU5_9FLAO|nr:hypothetical protein [Polaribacter marinus]MCI2229951.1 hypothetical protein [Polaribacter marinus]
MKKNLPSIIYEFINEYYSEEQNIYLVGSSRLELNNESDIDLLIVSKNIILFEETKLLYKDYLFHILILPHNNLLGVFSNQINKRGSLYNIFSNPIVIRSKSNYPKLISTLFTYNHYKMNKYKSLLKRRSVITGLLNLLKEEKSQEKFLFIYNQIFKLLVDIKINSSKKFPDYNLIEKGVIKSVRGLKDNVLEKNYLISKEFLIDDDKSKVINFVTEEFNKYGGELKNYSSRDILMDTMRDSLVIQIKLRKLNVKSINAFLAHDIFHSLSEIAKKHNSYFTFHPDNDIYQPGIYLIINESNKVIKSDILPKLNELSFLKSYQNTGVFINYPFNLNIDEGVEFGGKENYFLIQNCLKRFSEIQLAKREVSNNTFYITIAYIAIFLWKYHAKNKQKFNKQIDDYFIYHKKLLFKKFGKSQIVNHLEKRIDKETNHWIKKNQEAISTFFDSSFSNYNFGDWENIKQIPLDDINFIVENKSKLVFDEKLDYFEFNFIKEILNLSFFRLHERVLLFKIIISIFKIEKTS